MTNRAEPSAETCREPEPAFDLWEASGIHSVAETLEKQTRAPPGGQMSPPDHTPKASAPPWRADD